MSNFSLQQKLFAANPDAVFFDDMNDELIGLGEMGPFGPVAVYSKKKIYAALAALGLSPAAAEEYYMGRVIAVRAGEHTPLILNDLEQ